MKRLLTAALAAAVSLGGLASAQTPEIDIPYESFELENGLTVVVHEDRKAPIVAVSIWYGVGSADEPAGRTGFAHLFEHLMFNGSENYNDDYFGPFEQVGATGMNGTTWFDRTNYFQTVPTPALEMALWMESDRMTHLLGAIDQERLDEQRGVVQNEKRQGDNQPYGMVEYSQLRALFPEGHPYAHSTIGSMEDLDAASLEDVQDWFRQYYGASNAVLVLAGDIDAEQFVSTRGLEAVMRLFNDPMRKTVFARMGLEEATSITGRKFLNRVMALPQSISKELFEAFIDALISAISSSDGCSVSDSEPSAIPDPWSCSPEPPSEMGVYEKHSKLPPSSQPS